LIKRMRGVGLLPSLDERNCRTTFESL
jgi:hypothetical protein